MITEAIVGAFFTAVTWILDLLPDWTPSADVVGLDNTVNDWFGQFTGIGAWVPWPLIGIAIALVIGAAIFNVAARLVLWIYSLIPVFGGGS